MQGRKIWVLDHGYVTITQRWGCDEDIIRAARMSTDRGFEGWGVSSKPGDEKLLAYLWNNKHTSPFEMGGMTIEVKAPLFVFREWHRHRTQSYNEMSARYVPLPDRNYLPSVQRVVDAGLHAGGNKQAAGTSNFALTRETVEEDLKALSLHYQQGQKLYERLLSRGWPKELARLPVPVARYSKMWASGNLHNWLRFLTLRESQAAQLEIRLYAQAVHELLAEQFPRTLELFEKA